MPLYRSDFLNSGPYVVRGQEPPSAGGGESDYMAVASLHVRTGLVLNGNLRHSRGTYASANFVTGASGFELNAESGVVELNIVSLNDVSALTMGLGAILSLDSGAASLPSLAFAGDPNTGIYSFGADQVGFSAGGVSRWNYGVTNINSTLRWRGPDGAAATPGMSFENDVDTGLFRDAANQIGWSGGASKGGYLHSGGIRAVDGSATAPSISLLNLTGYGLYYRSTTSIGLATAGAINTYWDSSGNMIHAGAGRIYTLSDSDRGLTLRDTQTAGAITKYITFEDSGAAQDALIGMVVGALSIRNQTNDGITIFTNDTFRGQIEADGTFAWGGSGGSWPAEFDGNQDTYIVRVQSHNDLGTTAPEGINIIMGTDNDDPGTDDDYMLFRKNIGTPATVGAIDGDGVGGVRDPSTSDARKKANIRPTEADVHFDLIPWRTFEREWRRPRSKDTRTVTMHGVVAQEMYYDVFDANGDKPFKMYVKKPKDRGDEFDDWWGFDYKGVIGMIGGTLRITRDELADLERRVKKLEGRKALRE